MEGNFVADVIDETVRAVIKFVSIAGNTDTNNRIWSHF